MKVMEIMTPHAETIGPNEAVQLAARRMSELDVGSLPVCENDRLVGVVTDRDITVRSTAQGDLPAETRVADVMTPKVVYCFDDQDVSEAAQIMEREQVRRLIVLNRNKRLVGIVSLGDLAVKYKNDRLSGEALEQISEPAEVQR
jgi:CBS domain-containing protein